MNQNITPPNTLKVWDPLIRIFHWSLVLAFFVAYLTEDDWLSLHIATGEFVAMLVGFRLVWGLIGTRYARFNQFVRSPYQVVQHLKDMASLKPAHYLGHNPAAAAMIVALIVSLILLSLSGYALISTENQGFLAGTFIAGMNGHWLEEVHEFFANFTLLLVIAHIVGVFVSSFMERQNLPRAMISGYKRYRSDYKDFEGEQS